MTDVSTGVLRDVPHVLALSARSREALCQARLRLANHLTDQPESLADVAATLHHGRERFAVRCAVTATRLTEAVALLHQLPPDDTAARCETDTSRSMPPGYPPQLWVTFAAESRWGDDGPHYGLPQVQAALATTSGTADPAVRSAAVQRALVAWLTSLGVEPDQVRFAQPPGAESPPHPDPVPAAEIHMVLRGGQPVRSDALLFDVAEPGSYSATAVLLWNLGFDVDVTLGRPGRRLRLPGYAFEHQTGESISQSAPAEAGSEEIRPLTYLEQRRLFHDLVRTGEGAEYNRTAAGILTGPLDHAEIQSAFSKLQEHHPQLRTVLEEAGGRWRARVLAMPSVPVIFLDAAHASGGPSPEGVLAMVAKRPFHHADGPLVRCCVIASGAEAMVALTVYEPMALTVPVTQLHDELLAFVR
jgi:Condensation domain